MSEATVGVKMLPCEADLYGTLGWYGSRGESKGRSESGGGGGIGARAGAEYCRHVRAADISVLYIQIMLWVPLGGTCEV